jgi:hypothetical protein
VLIVGPAVLLHPSVPQPDGTLLYELLTGHPDRTPQELVFLADLAVELRAWPADTWRKVGVDPQAAAQAVLAGWRRGDLPGLGLGGLSAQEALALGAAGHDLCARPAWRPAAAPARPGGPTPVAAGPATAGPVTAPPRAADIRLPKCLRHGLRRTLVVRTAGQRQIDTTAADPAAGHGWRLLPPPTGCVEGVRPPGITRALVHGRGWASGHQPPYPAPGQGGIGWCVRYGSCGRPGGAGCGARDRWHGAGSAGRGG